MYVSDSDQYIAVQPSFTTGYELWRKFDTELQRQLLATLLVGTTAKKLGLFYSKELTKTNESTEQLLQLIKHIPSDSEWLFITAAQPRQLRQADDLAKLFASLAVSAQWLPLDTALAHARLDNNCNSIKAYQAVESDQLVDLVHYADRHALVGQACTNAQLNIDRINNADVIYIDAGEWDRLNNALTPKTADNIAVPTAEWLRIQQRYHANEVSIVVIAGFDVFAEDAIQLK